MNKDEKDLGAALLPVDPSAAVTTESLPDDGPFTVAVDENGCERCGHGKLWTVVCPDGTAIGQSFADQEIAEDIAEYMNQGYRVGCGGE